jgi:hypothetical protein
MIFSLKNLFRINNKGGRRFVQEQLQLQRYLLRTGVQASAEVLDVFECTEPARGYVQVRLWVLIRANGTITYRHIQTLLNKKNIPAAGDSIHIRFCPDDVKKVMVV